MRLEEALELYNEAIKLFKRKGFDHRDGSKISDEEYFGERSQIIKMLEKVQEAIQSEWKHGSGSKSIDVDLGEVYENAKQLKAYMMTYGITYWDPLQGRVVMRGSESKKTDTPSTSSSKG